MLLVLASVVLLILSAFAALVFRSSSRCASIIGAGGTVVGSILSLIPAVSILMGNPVERLSLPWNFPFASFSMEIDLLSSFFLLPICLVSAMSALFGADYFTSRQQKKSPGAVWFIFNLLVASMILVVVARNAILFLFAWEGMSLASFCLVTIENQDQDTYQPGWTYLVATHFSTAFLLVMFLLLGGGNTILDFAGFAPAPELTSIIFLLALLGFGIKAGFIPLHVWLPEAYPAVPGHILTVMSGVMIKTAIYGIFRVLAFLGEPPLWWGWSLIVFGSVSAFLGVLFALAQHDLKRLLAYHSIENMGIIAMGMGIGLLGLSTGVQVLTVLGFAGALLHVMNHALFKGLLFLGAGAVQHVTGTVQIDRLGGLLKKMPWTGTCFLIGAVAISGLPPLNGFISEFLIYLGAFHGVIVLGKQNILAVSGVIAVLALSGGLAAACFTKVFGIVFLGEPRTEQAAGAREVGRAMRVPMLVLAGGCILIGLSAPVVVHALIPVVAEVLSLPTTEVHADLAGPVRALTFVLIAQLGFLVVLVFLIAVRRQLLSGRTVDTRVTWDCGYARPTPRMQYTSSSFAQPLTALFSSFLRTQRTHREVEGFFPAHGSFHSHVPDLFREKLYKPICEVIEWLFARLRWLQHGRVHLYVLYIMITLLILLIWKIG